MNGVGLRNRPHRHERAARGYAGQGIATMARPVYTVLDVETTGLSPRTNRIVEVALLDVDATGRIDGEFVTLLNPGRDIGPTHIHHIRAADVVHAPTFAAIAPFVLSRLAGRVVVGHNVAFDWRFLCAEFARLGMTLPETPTLCTMRLADAHLDHLHGRSLGGCCSAAHVRHDDRHSALGDARATAHLLAAYRATGRLPATWWAAHPGQATGVRWPACPVAGAPVAVTRAHVDARRAAEVPYLARLVAALPSHSTGDAHTDTYVAVLDAALEDRRVSDAEARQLGELAEDLGLSGPVLAATHDAYLGALAATALADGVVTDAERADLGEVARLLGLPGDAVDTALSRARTAGVAPLSVRLDGALSAGQSVVFTGDTDAPRERLEALASDAGLRVCSSVSAKTALLVVADAASQSAKARRAAELGTRVVSEQVFLRLVADTRPAAESPAATRPPRPSRPAVPPARPDDVSTALAGRRVLLVGLDAEVARQVTAVVTGADGRVAAYVKDSLLCVVAEPESHGHARVVQARTLGVPVVDVAGFLLRYGTAPEPAVAGPAAGATTSPAPPPAGWYPDPWAAAPVRWWDGHGWTPHVYGRA